MKGLLALGVATLLSALTLMPSAVSARGCPTGCGRQAAACVQTARVNLFMCRAGCRPASAAGACEDSCTATFRAAKSTCRADRASCNEMCPPPPPPSSCTGAFLDTCGTELAACARGVVTQAKACVRTCKGVADPVGCFGGCAAAAEEGAAACATSFDACIGRCRPTTTTTTTLPGQPCTNDTQCDDGVPCTVDHCDQGTCEHACVCLDATGAPNCCPGPANLCVRPCGADASGVCGGTCPVGATCESLGTAAPQSCRCVSGLGGPCGGNIFPLPPVCAPGLVCQQSNPDVTGVCVQGSCIPFFADGCTETSDCCSPCTVLHRAPCAVCLQGRCDGTP
jgi:hypothetical protein